MKIRKALLLATLGAATVAAFACSSGGKKGGNGGSPTPTAGPKSNYTLTGSGFTPGGTYNGDIVGFRVLQGTTVVYCTTAGVIGGGTFTALVATSALSTGLSFHGEAFVSNGNATYDSSADLSFYDPAVGTTAGTTFVATSNGRMWAISKTPTQPITWPNGTTCP